MNRLALAISLLCISAQQGFSQDFMTREEHEAYMESVWDTSCENPKNADRWGIRPPKPSEVAEYGAGIMVFEYYNSPQGCSDGTPGLGIWYEGQRWGTMVVEVLGREYDSNERITFTLEDVPYTAITHPVLLVPDAIEPHTIILLPLIS